MSAEKPFHKIMLPALAEDVAWQARAKITWGEPPVEVRAWIVSQGIKRSLANEIVKACDAERARSMRLRGISGPLRRRRRASVRHRPVRGHDPRSSPRARRGLDLGRRHVRAFLWR